MNEINIPKVGHIYRHYKGHMVEVLNIAKHTENQEDLVIYMHLSTKDIWARPLSMWFDEIKFTPTSTDNRKYDTNTSSNNQVVITTRFVEVKPIRKTKD